MSEQKTQDEIDREQMIAGVALGEAILNKARFSGERLTREKMDEIENQMQKLMIPQRYKELSASDMRDLIFGEYVETVSIGMMKVRPSRSLTVTIKARDLDILPSLQFYWTDKKGFKCEEVKNESDVENSDLVDQVIVLSW